MYSKTHKLSRALKPLVSQQTNWKNSTIGYSSRGTDVGPDGPGTSQSTGTGTGTGHGGSKQTGSGFGCDRGTGMKSWQIHSYGGPSSMHLVENVQIPILQHHKQLLIKVKASSVNPIDVAMSHGYGSKVVSVIRDAEKCQIPNFKNLSSTEPGGGFPLTLGRDFSGVVVETGVGIGTRDIQVGDEVFGALGFTEHGAHAEYTVANRDLVHKKPEHLTHVEAASFPYVALTAWSAIKITGNFCNCENKRFLVLGGSGGVGTFAIQYLKSNGAQVVTTCSADAVPLLEFLGANSVIDYASPDCDRSLDSYAPYDCILNVAGPKIDSIKYLHHLKPVCGQYITLSPPALSNFDRHGFIGGALRNAADLIKANVTSLTQTRTVTKWAFFVPAPIGFRDISKLVQQKKILPVVDKIYNFSEMPEAYDRVDGGHLRGKTVVLYE